MASVLFTDLKYPAPMNDQDHNEPEGAARGDQAAPKGKEPGEFTRQFFSGEAKPTPAAPPLAADAIKNAGANRPSASGPAAGPGDFTRMFGDDDNPARRSPDSSGRSELNPQQTGEAGDFTKQFGGNVQLPDARTSAFDADEASGPSATAAGDPASAPRPPRADFPVELRGPARSGGTPRAEEKLVDVFRHPLAPHDSMDLRPSGMRDEASSDTASPSGYTKLFSEVPPPPKQRPAPSNTIDFPAPQPRGGPSDYTRVVSRGNAVPAPSAAPPSPAAPSQGLPQMPSPALPSIPPPPSPPMPVAYPPQVQVQYIPATPPAPPPMPQAPSLPAPQITAPSAQTPPGAKWVAYLPVLIVINVLFMIAVLVVLFFALKK